MFNLIAIVAKYCYQKEASDFSLIFLLFEGIPIHLALDVVVVE